MPVKIGYTTASVATLKALSTVDFITGYAKFVVSTEAWWYYDSTSSATGNDITIATPLSGVGRWFKGTGFVNLASTSEATGVLQAASFPALTGAITTSAGNLATSLGANIVNTGNINNSQVTLAKLANLPAETIIGNNTLSSAVPLALTTTQVKAMLAINGNTDIDYPTPLAINKGGTGVTTLTGFFNTISPITTVGDLIYGSGSNTATRLAGNFSGTRKFLSQTGDNVSIPNAPVWHTLLISDISDLAVFNYTTAGLVPFPSGAGTTRFLREDGAWATAGGASGNPITVQDEGSTLTTALTTLNCVGAGVTATNTGGDVILTITGAVSWDTIDLDTWDALQ